jgi:hypothetical protein
MTRVLHGQMPTTLDSNRAQMSLAANSVVVPLAFAAADPVDLHEFDFMFPTLQDDAANLLPVSPDMPAKLRALALTMEDSGGPDPGDSAIPAGYTYFAQFVDHDITFEVQPADLPPTESGSMAQLLDPNMTPLSLPVIRNVLRNFRTATLDLDSGTTPWPSRSSCRSSSPWRRTASDTRWCGQSIFSTATSVAPRVRTPPPWTCCSRSPR